MLGRPQMIQKELCDVLLHNPTELDGTRDTFGFAQNIFVSLADLLGEVSDKVVISSHIRNSC